MSTFPELIKEASFFVSLQPADSSSIEAAESQLGITFALDYKEYLLAFGAASFDGRELTGVCKSERLNVVSATERARSFYPQFPKNKYVVEELGFDHVLILQDSSGKVYSYGPSDSGDVIAKSLQDYLFPNSASEETK